MKSILYKYFKEAGVLLITLISVSIFWYYQFNIRQENYIRGVQKNVSSALTQMKVEALKLSRLSLMDSLPFTKILSVGNHKAFIFINNKLVYWTDAQFVPDYETIKGDYHYKLFNLKSGKFVIYHYAYQSNGKRTEIYELLPVYFNYEIENTYLQSSINTKIIPKKYGVVLSNDASNHLFNIYAPDGSFLFSLDISSQVHPPYINLFTLIFLCLIIYFFVWVKRYVKYLEGKSKYEWAIVILTIYFIGLRYFMIENDLGLYLTEWNIFDSKFYASSRFNPSLGDLALNIMCLLYVIWYIMGHFLLSDFYAFVLKLRRPFRFIICTVLIFAMHGSVVIPFDLIKGIYLHSQAPLNTIDITIDLEFSSLRYVCLLCFILCAILYFIILHICGYIFCRMYSDLRQLLGLLAGATTAIAIILYFKEAIESDFTLLLISTFYCFFIVIFNLPGSLYRFRYVTSVYLFSSALASAAIGSHAIYHMEQEKKNIVLAKYAQQWLAENDEEGEFLLNQALNDIEKDYFIKIKFRGVLNSIEAIKKKIKRFHINPYFDKYDLNILIFNNKGEPYPGNGHENKNYLEYARQYRLKKYKTPYDDIYFNPSYSGEDIIKEYISFSHIDKDSSTLGYIILDFKQKKISINNVYPELLLDRSMVNTSANADFSYAIFQDRKLLFNSGNYNYKNYFPLSLFNHPEIADHGVTANGYHHLLIKGKNFETDRKQILVSSVRYPVRYIFSNLSFLFLLLVVIASVIIFYSNIKQQSSYEYTSFSSKVQIYLNLAFFLPLLVVSSVILNRVASISKENLKKNFVSKALAISNNLTPFIEAGQDGQMNADTLLNKILQLSKYAGSDINIFNPKGVLVASSQPRIYEKGILSNYINPYALKEITERGFKEVLLEESVGKLKYNSVYVGIKANAKTGWPGIVSIPFFASQSESDKQIIELLASILNIFTTVFIIFLLLSYLASRLLTFPLRIIAQKLTKTSLNEYNEPLQWKSDDEIGLLVGEYNKMLINLEKSKKALSTSEKESAWREMAQQVAHEIKNPLTPMKLTLQHLQRILVENQSTQHFSNAIYSLLEQIDSLSDIASSFSTFAKMPVPKEEMVDIVTILHQTIELYNNDENIVIEEYILATSCIIKSDAHILNGIFSNIILNGIQSVPSNRKPVLKINFSIENKSALIKINDNGKGIPQNIRDKVFVPNFSTKYAGSGIGLALAKKGIEHAGGKIWFETEENVGTTFFISLPVWENE